MVWFNHLIFQCIIYCFFVTKAAIAGSDGIAISPQEWRELTEGKTVYYSISGEHYGREYYVPGSDLVFFEHDDGTCMTGVWSFEAPWYSFTFSYDGFVLPPHRFLHLRANGVIHVISDESDLPRQQVDRIIFAPFSCAEDVTS